MLASIVSKLLPSDRQPYLRMAFFGLWSTVLCCLVFLPMLVPAVRQAPALIGAYILTVAVSHMALLNAAGVLLAAAAYTLSRSRVVAYGSVFALLLALSLLLFVDVSIFSIFRFHINGMVLSLVLSSAGWDSLDLNTATIVKAAMAASLLLLIQAAGLLLAMRGARGVLWLGRRPGAVLACVLAACLVTNLAVYAYGDLLGHRGITQVSKLFPLYQPLTVKRLAAKTFNFKRDTAPGMKGIRTVGQLAYPLRPVDIGPDGSRYNIVLAVLDAWRFDMLSEAVTPNLTAFAAQHATTFANHYSGGNASRFGIFSLLYGLPGSYWHEVLKQSRSSVLLDALGQAGYDFRITSSTDLRWPEFRDTAFVNLAADDLLDSFDTKVKHERDRILTDTFKAFAAERAAMPEGKPFFYFMFFDSSHGPYSYPKDYEKYDAQGEIDYVSGDDASVRASRNQYMNALWYLDHLSKEIMDAVLDSGLAENTILIFTGDHGEEFREMGFWGHNSAFDPYQTKVPFLIYWPGRAPALVEKLTSHHDLAPTLLGMLGSRNDPADYSIGQDLFTHQGHRYVLSAGWNDAAYIDGSRFCIFPTESHSGFSMDVRDERYQPVESTGAALGQIQPYLLQITKDMGRFYQH